MNNDGKPFMIANTATNECPVSLLDSVANKHTSGESPQEIVQEYARVKVMKDSIGAVPYGGDLHKWPARKVDAFVILQDEQSKVDALRISTKT